MIRIPNYRNIFDTLVIVNTAYPFLGFNMKLMDHLGHKWSQANLDFFWLPKALCTHVTKDQPLCVTSFIRSALRHSVLLYLLWNYIGKKLSKFLHFQGNDMKDHFAGLGLAAAAASGRVNAGLEGFPGGHPLLSHMQVKINFIFFPFFT